ncbi:MAG: Gfo/Idh/MocA family oxidoreductase [Bryobacteraceae bacterium]|nr:Gfo/Idh/MocA family oxidoreductase [Bryobacteraceae bacterium]
MIDLNLGHMPPPPSRKDFRIGAIGAGFIMKDVHLVAYRDAGYNVAAIASAEPESSRAVAERHGIPRAYETYQQLLADESIEILDVAVPPHAQPEVIREAVRHADHVKGILAQKPLATSYKEALAVTKLCEEAGIALGVNQNMRYDQSIRALKTVLERGYLGEPALGTIEMRAIPHWMPWCRLYGRLTLLIMSIHHLDTFRYLFGEPESVYASARTDPRTKFEHRDGIVLYILEYANGLRAAAWDDVWAGPAREGAASDIYIKWRVEGTEGMAQGTIGWPAYPNAAPSTIQFTTARQPGVWFAPQWKEVWFPDAFRGTMGMLLDAVANQTEPAVSGRNHLGTMALVEACYRSLDERRPVRIEEITTEER